MCYGQFVQNLLALRGKLHQHLSSVVRVTCSLYEAEMLKAIDEPDGAVMPNEKSFGKMTDGGQSIRWQPLQNQQSLMLLRFDTEGLRGFLTEIEEPPNLKAKFFELAKFRQLKVETAVPHIYIVPRYKFAFCSRSVGALHRCTR